MTTTQKKIDILYNYYTRNRSVNHTGLMRMGTGNYGSYCAVMSHDARNAELQAAQSLRGKQLCTPFNWNDLNESTFEGKKLPLAWDTYGIAVLLRDVKAALEEKDRQINTLMEHVAHVDKLIAALERAKKEAV